MSLDRNSQQALDLFREAKKRCDAGKDRSIGFDVAPMRVRLARDVDLTKANPSCKRCHGTGKVGDKLVPGTRAGDQMRVPLICRCVVKGGGVRMDKIDEMMGAVKKKPVIAGIKIKKDKIKKNKIKKNKIKEDPL